MQSRKKSVDDPNVRNEDPECWKCLSNEQRDIINEWYCDDCERNEKWAKKEQDQATSANQFAMIPLAAWTAYVWLQKGYIWAIPIYFFLGLGFFSLIHSLFSDVYYYFNTEKPTKWKSLIQYVIAAGVCFFVIALISNI